METAPRGNSGGSPSIVGDGVCLTVLSVREENRQDGFPTAWFAVRWLLSEIAARIDNTAVLEPYG